MQYVFIFLMLVMFCFNYEKTKKSLHMLQQNWYNDGNRYLKWLFGNLKSNFLNLELLMALYIIFKFTNYYIYELAIGIVFYLLLIVITKEKVKKEQNKKPLVFTKRVKRLVFTSSVIYLVPAVVFSYLYNMELTYLYILIYALMIYLNRFIVLLCVYINAPVEKLINLGFKKKALKKLHSMTNMSVVGITGSYGKTSSKNILSDILNVKFNAFPTPKNYNTPLGLILTINNYLDKFNDLFIAEMGAFKRGEIKELCDLVHPKYGILTTIGTAHLDSFGSRENIQKGKFELIESLPADGVGVLNMDDPYQVSYKLKNNCKILWIGIDNKDADVRATNITLTKDGTSFDCIFKGDKNKYRFETRLLGKANVYNILAGIALGKELGLNTEQLILGVKKVNAVEHRLELKKGNGYYIIDDAYNSNPVGSSMALDVLDLMPGKKVIITPGMIEMGDEEYNLNKEFGRHIAKVCDEVILVGTKQTKPIQDGIKEEKFNEKNLHIIDDVKEAFGLMEKIKQGETYCLIENDLPDIFNEK